MPTSTPFKFNSSKLKRKGAEFLDTIGFSEICFKLQKKLLSPFIRAVNYHVVFPRDSGSFEEHLRYYGRNFVGVDKELLAKFLATGEWPHSRPGLIVTFDDGHRTHYKVAAPLLEKYGFTGWFFIPVGMMNLNGGVEDDGVSPDPEFNVLLNLKELKYLGERHIVGSHTETHRRLGTGVSPDVVSSEVIGSKQHLEELLRHPIDVFCWVGGEEDSYGKEASDVIRKHYDFGFMTNSSVIRPRADSFQLQRTNIEAENPLSLVKFQLSGLVDLYYAGKRRRVNRLTGREF